MSCLYLIFICFEHSVFGAWMAMCMECECVYVSMCVNVYVFLGSNYPPSRREGRLGGLASAPGWCLPSLKPCFLWLFVAFCWVLVELVEHSPGSGLLGRQRGAGSIGFRGWNCTLTTDCASSTDKPWVSGRSSSFLALPLNLGFFLRFLFLSPPPVSFAD